MCTHSIDDLLPHAPLHYAATGEMVKGSYYYNIHFIYYKLIGIIIYLYKLCMHSRFMYHLYTSYTMHVLV